MKDKVMESILAHSKKYGASGHVPFPPVKAYICPTCKTKHHKARKPEWYEKPN